MKRRVVITGLGLISPHGDKPDQVFDALMSGQSAVTRWDQGTAAQPALVAPARFEPSRFFTRLQLAGVDRFSQLAVAAAELATTDRAALFETDGYDGGV